MTDARDGYCFGYGSLANRDTHDFEIAGIMTLRGWRRSWAHWVTSNERKATSLTIVPSDNAAVLGAVLKIPATGWAGLAERERGYDCSSIQPTLIAEPSGLPSATQACHTYISRQDGAGGDDHPIYLSYIDTVAQGFFQIGGADAAQMFFATTDRWATPILNDRDAPKYPRATVLSAKERQMVDTALVDLSVRWAEPR